MAVWVLPLISRVRAHLKIYIYIYYEARELGINPGQLSCSLIFLRSAAGSLGQQLGTPQIDPKAPSAEAARRRATAPSPPGAEDSGRPTATTPLGTGSSGARTARHPAIWLWLSKLMRPHLRVGEFPTHFRTYFSGDWELGVRDFDPGPYGSG